MQISRDFPFPRVLDNLQEVFSNVVPRELRRFARSRPVPPWRLAEEAVYWFFRYHLSLPTVSLGANTLFHHEPEGLVAGLGRTRQQAMIYECKCRTGPYVMTHDDYLRYRSYIEAKKVEAEALHLNLTNFLIIAPRFKGAYSTKLNGLCGTGVCASGLNAGSLQNFHQKVEDWKLERIQMLDLSNVLRPGLVGVNQINREVSRVSSQYRNLID